MGFAPHLSIVIPAFNEGKRISRTLETLQKFLERQGWKTEVIVVNDGSSDDTAAVVESYRARWNGLQLLDNGGNRGKGFSVRNGALVAQGDVILFTDADLSSPITEASKLIDPILDGHCDVAFGSRAIDRSLIGVHQSPFRETSGRIFNLFVQGLTGLAFKDTQCGFKAFTARAAQTLFPRQKIERWGFDPELLFLARKFGLPVREIAVEWAHDDRSKISYLKDGLHMGVETLKVRWYSLTGQYAREAPECVVNQV